jgi:F0F1-type ATP synthase membrane subunit b/b'
MTENILLKLHSLDLWFGVIFIIVTLLFFIIYFWLKKITNKKDKKIDKIIKLIDEGKDKEAQKKLKELIEKPFIELVELFMKVGYRAKELENEN